MCLGRILPESKEFLDFRIACCGGNVVDVDDSHSDYTLCGGVEPSWRLRVWFIDILLYTYNPLCYRAIVNGGKPVVNEFGRWGRRGYSGYFV